MTASNEGLMKLIGLTKQQREIGPVLQEYVRRKYGVENMATFAKEDIEGVDDKEVLYLQWAAWIEAGELSRFKDDGASAQPADVERTDATAEADPQGGEQEAQEVADTAAQADEVAEDKPAEVEAAADDEEAAAATAEAEPEPEPEPSAAPETPQQTLPAEEPAVAGSVDAAIRSMIRSALDSQPKPEQPVTEARVREIVQEELRRILQSLLK